MTAALMRISSE